ncbi:MAG: 3-deoxy-D-manno-octulosonic acid transferase [Alphaproteobacteria bacterium]|nr:3-deoxy-D-manno-octulosonic acid transferase [Alphaproteobacteria bacterium]
MKVPFPLVLYQRLTPFLEKGALLYLRYRLKKGKEDPKRLAERFGKASQPRPKGVVAWFHGASVGEAVSLLPILRRIRIEFPHITPLVTTGTVTASTVIAKSLPNGCIHQYSPLDLPSWIQSFLDHWQPDIAVFVESEFWPNLILNCKNRQIPLYLINAALSEKSYQSWRRVPATIDYLLSCFELLLAQSKAVAKRLRDLGATPSKVRVCGNLKFAATPLTCDLGELKQLQTILKDRSVWVAASTHSGEEILAANVHNMVKNTLPKLLTVIIPRHPRRGQEIAQELRAKGLQVARRSGQERIKPSTDIYLVDTVGELGLFYRLSHVAFLGGTFVPIGGHNPIEAVLLDCALIWGPYTHKQTEICSVLSQVACSITTKEELAINLERLFLEGNLRAEKIARAHQLLQIQAHILDHVMNALKDSLPKVA